MNTSTDDQWTETPHSVIEELRENERLCPTGSGAMTCCGGRGAGDQQGSVEDEERSDETGGLARCAGVGEAGWILDFADELADRASKYDRLAEVEYRHDNEGQSRLRARAGELRKVYHELIAKLPKPDSEAPKERSGRRNA